MHAAVQVLVDFVEKEHPDKVVDWNADEALMHAWEEIQSLYKWWKETRPARRSPLDDGAESGGVIPPLELRRVPGSDVCEMVEPDKYAIGWREYAEYYRALDEDFRLEEQWYEEDQCNLHRLIEIRGYLWT